MASYDVSSSSEVVADDTGLHDACGVFGCVARTWPTQLDVAHVLCLGMIGVQHRGQESAGMVTSEGHDAHRVTRHKGMGLVSQVFTEDVLRKFKNANLGIGHTRYSTAGDSEVINCQPFVVETLHGLISVAHNGELVNANPLKQMVLKHGVGLSSGSDSELITQMIAGPPPDGEPDGPDWLARIKHLMSHTWTSYSLLIMHKDAVYAVRDPFGNRPLCLGKLMTSSALGPYVGLRGNKQENEDEFDGYVVSSESCSFPSIGASYYREVLPGEIVKITKDGFRSLAVVPRPKDVSSAFCIFEYVYFARPDSMFEGQMVYSARKRCGQQLAREAPVKADVVSTVPESATPAALGFAEESGIPYMEVLCKNRYVGRTFIQPSMRLRQLGVAKKFGPLTDNFKGKRVVLIDDSIVRGNTMGPIIRMIKNAGAQEVHVRIASPPLKYPCYMGINIPTRGELIANKLNPEELAAYLGADSLSYLSVGGLTKAIQRGIEKKEEKNIGHCTACLTGKYPVDLSW